MSPLYFIVAAAGLGVVLFAMLGLVLSRLWRRATPERALVRTGGSKMYVTMEGGCFQIPIIHEITPVNMNTMRLDIGRDGDNSLITKDRLRVDVSVAFFTRVARTHDGIGTAASSLGRRTLDPLEIKKLIESKFDDALRAVAMSMTLPELLDQRDQFRQAVLNAVGEDLKKNGLELEAVSITTLNQTDVKFFKADNVIDAEGLTSITRQTESRRRERNDISQETEVAIQERNLQAAQRTLTIRQTEEKAKLEQSEQIATMTAEQNSRIASNKAAQAQAAKESEIQSERAVEQAQIARKQAIELSEQLRRIAIANKSQEQSNAEAEANQARAKAARSEEEVVTATEVARAERTKQIAVIASNQAAEQDAVKVRVLAKAEREAADDRAQAVLTEARASADAAELEARGIKARALAEAEGKTAINAAENSLSDAQIALRRALAIIENLPAILQAQMKPLEKMSDFKVVHFSGMTPGINGGGAPGVAPAAGGGFAHQLLDAVQQYRMQSPIVEAALRDVGLIGADGKLSPSGINLGSLRSDAVADSPNGHS